MTKKDKLIIEGKKMKYLCIARNLIALLFFLSCLIHASCNRTNKDIEKQDKYDGTYNISCISENVYAAIGDITINSNKISGTIVNTKNFKFTITGTVNDKGMILFNTISNNLGKITAFGQVSEDGYIKGMYSVNTRKGKYFGFRYEKEEIDTNLNGVFEIDFLRNDRKTAHLRIQIHNGEFRSEIESINHVKYPVKGRVLTNGRIIINTVIGSRSKGIAAYGIIRGKSLKGHYFLHTGDKGSFYGKGL
jgi:hypothetical protein